MAEPQGAAAVAVEGLRKAFGATVAVDDVSFRIAPATVHALLGENGAGKSTIVKLLSGLIEPDQGHFAIHGQPARLGSPRAAHALGIQTAFQEMTLVRDLTVLDNMLLPYAPVGFTGMIRRRSAESAVRAHLDSLGFDVDLRDEVGGLDLAVQQKIEIARAIYRKPRILLLDEPTSTLAGRDVDWLGEVIARLKASGVTVVFISHRMREVRAFCDHLTVLRNGRHIATGAVADFSDDADHRDDHRPLDRPDLSAPSRGQPHPGGGGLRGREPLGRAEAAQRQLRPPQGRDPRRRRAPGHGPARPLPRRLRHARDRRGPDSASTAGRCRSTRRSMRSAPTSRSASCRRTARPRRCSSSSPASTTSRCR